MEISPLVETVLQGVSTSRDPRAALTGFLKGTAVSGQEQEPGNDYSASLFVAIKMLEDGVPLENLIEELRKKGL